MIDTPPATVLEIRAASIRGPQLRLRDLRIQAQGPSPRNLRWQLQSGAAQSTGAMHWQQFHAQGQLQTHSGAAELRADATVRGSVLGNLYLRGQGKISSRAGQLHLRLTGKQIGSWQGEWHSAGHSAWAAHINGAGTAAILLQQWFPATWQPQGTLQASISARGASWQNLQEAHLHATLSKLQFSSPDGLQALQDGALHLDTQLTQTNNIWWGNTKLQWLRGAALWSPWYTSAPPQGITLNGHWNYRAHHWQVTEADLRWPGMGQARFSAASRPGATTPTIDLQQASLHLQPLWQTWLRPLLPSSGLAHRLEARGQLQISGRYTAGGLSALRWQLQDASLHDPQGQFELQDITSQGAWQQHETSSHAELRWLYGGFYGIPFGPLDAQFLLRGHAAELQAPAVVSVLGGRLHVNHLQANWQSASPSVVLSGGVDHIQLGSLTRTFGWPHFSGTLAAQIPQLRYHQGNLSTSSIMRAHAFGGEIRIDGLSLQGLFTPTPLLQTNIQLQNLQLKPLTDVFPIGYISGVLNGKVNKLSLLNWQPVSFDAKIATHRDPAVPQEISAAAIEKLTKLGGGGVSSVFQNLFLQFFRKFSYAKLGIGVDLRDGVANLSGVANAQNGGFYLLKGQGLPQVNIIGYNRRSNWQELLSRLRAVMEGKTQVATGD
ncbi:hypothetical protein AB4090_08570 [Acidithiobacillus sp. IBUN Pt1247-S3]|uniref:hypothetical protein n=1 Tax=Acidithiobacillus sp. IBUN Pt1247-S3 TaxID=3166642 RepID=UPI0034E451A2